MRKKKIFAVLLAFTMGFSSIPFSSLTARAETKEERSLVEYVNTLFGTDNNAGSTSGGPALPNASIYPSPETQSPDNGGYHSGNKVIGFGQMYTQGTGGTPSYGNFLLSPQSGESVATKDSDHASPVSDEIADANYYSAVLDTYGIKTEVTPAEHSAIYRFTYPKDRAASFILDVSRRIGGGVSLKSGSVTIDKENKMITGGGTFKGNWNPAEWNMYVALQFDGVVNEIGVWDNSGLQADTLTLDKASNSEHFGAYVKLDSTKSEVVNVKLAISFVSVEKAKEFLKAEIPGFDFDGERAEAEEKWNAVLGKVELGGEVDELTKEKFYTALYQANIQPRDRTADHGNWDDYYTLWDSWRTVFPFLQLTRPDMIASNINSFIKRWNENGMMSDAFIQGKEYLCGQGGNDIENVIADAYLKGIEGVDWEAAYQAVKGDAENYRSAQYAETGYHYSGTTAINGQKYSGRLKPSSATVGFAYNDYSVATMARGLGHMEDYEFYIARSKNWLNNWDENCTSSDGYTGFIHKRGSDGTFPSVNPSLFKGYDGTESLWQGYNDDFYEAGIWEGSYSPTFDLPTLVEKMGGKYAYGDRLNYALSQGYMNYANEPSFQTIWTFCADEVRRPDLAAYWANEYLKRFTDTGYPGDEDNGAMSTMYLFIMSGFFPMSGTNNYYLHGTKLPEITYHLGTGNDFVIKGINAGGENIYVQSAAWNGEALNNAKLTWEQISKGGTLEYVMGDTPGKWGYSEDNEAPTDVSNLRITCPRLAEGKLTLSFDAASDNEAVSGYRIYASDRADMPLDETTLAASVNTTEYDFDVADRGGYFRVEAIDYRGNKSPDPPVIKADVDDSEAPVLGGELTVDSRYSGIGLTKLGWEAGSDNTMVIEYRIYRGDTEDFVPGTENQVASTKEVSYLETKTAGTYYYKVCAADAFDNLSAPLCAAVTHETGLTGKEMNVGLNVASGAAVTVSGKTNDGEGGPKAVDGYTNTKWCCKEAQSSEPGGFWLELDLGEVCQLNQWVVKHAETGGERAGYNTKDFKLQAKTEGGEWLDVDAVEGNTAKVTKRDVPTFESRYVRLYITKAVQDGEAKTARIYEFELYNGINTGIFEGSLMALDGVTAMVNGQANEKEGAEKTYDFDLDTKWSCRNSADDNGYYWMEIALPGIYRVNALHLLSAANEFPDYITRDFNLQVKKNGQWKDVLTVTGNPDNLYYGELERAAIGSEFRLLIKKLGSENKDNARVYEFHLYGEKAEGIDRERMEVLERFLEAVRELDYTKYSKESQVKIREAEKAAVDALTAWTDDTLTAEMLKEACDLANQTELLLAVYPIQVSVEKPDVMEAPSVVAVPTGPVGEGVSVTLEISDVPEGYRLIAVTVSGEDGKNVNVKEVTAGVPEGEHRFTFAMPRGKADVTAVFRADTRALTALLKESEEIAEEDYKHETFKVFLRARKDAMTAAGNPEASREEVEAAVSGLQAAIGGLVSWEFDDVEKESWFYDAVHEMYSHEIMTGYNPEENTFNPYGILARAQFALTLYRMNGEETVEFAPIFPDVPEGSWYTSAVLWANRAGVITGYGEAAGDKKGFFGPADNIQRQQMAVMMYRYAKYREYDVSEKASLGDYTDAGKVDDYAEEAMEWAVGAGIISGKDNRTRLDPAGNTSRAECAVILQRFTEKYTQN